MAKQLQQGRLTAEIVYETYGDNFGRTKGYAISSLKGAFRSGKNASFAIAVFDGDSGKQIGIDITGDPSEQMKNMMETAFAEDEPQEVTTA